MNNVDGIWVEKSIFNVFPSVSNLLLLHTVQKFSLPEDGVLLRYILKADQRERDIESVHLEHKVECGDAAVGITRIHDEDFCYTEENSLMYSISEEVQYNKVH